MALPTLVAGKNTRVFLHSRNVSCQSAEVSGTMERQALEAKTFCGIQRVAGVESGKYSIRGYLASDDPTLERQLSRVFNGEISPAYFVDAPYCAAGYPCYGGEIKGSTVKVASPVENIVTIDGEVTLLQPDATYVQGYGPAFRGRILYYAGDAGVTLAGGVTTVDGDAVQMGRSVGGRIYVPFHLSWVPPLTDTVAVTIQTSANGTTGWTTIPGVSGVIRAEPMGPGDGVLVMSWSRVIEDAYWRVRLQAVGPNAKQFYNLFAWTQPNTGGGTEGRFVIVQDGDGGAWVWDDGTADWVVRENAETENTDGA